MTSSAVRFPPADSGTVTWISGARVFNSIFRKIPVDLQVFIRQLDIIHLADFSDLCNIVNISISESRKVQITKASREFSDIKIQVIQFGAEICTIVSSFCRCSTDIKVCHPLNLDCILSKGIVYPAR